MGRAEVTTLHGKRRPVTRRGRPRDWRRGARRRVWIGSRARARAGLPLFFSLRTQQMRRVRLADWLGAASMLLGATSWGVLAALLGS